MLKGGVGVLLNGDGHALRFLLGGLRVGAAGRARLHDLGHTVTR